MKKLKEAFKSVRVKLFLTLSISILIIILLLIIINNVVLESYYMLNKENTLKNVYNQINIYYNNQMDEDYIEAELEKISIKNNFDILIRNNSRENVYSSEKNFVWSFEEINAIKNKISINAEEILEKTDTYTMKKLKDYKNGITYIFFSGKLDNGYTLYLRMPVTAIEDSVRISNNFLYLIAGFTILIGGIIILVVSRKFTEPILELNDIAKKMSKLDFSQKYRITDADDEINNLGKSINIMSDKLEKTIKQLRNTNMELEKDIEEKSKIDEMRKQFISDVSHELKTPIALIQGYAEGLVENVNADDESRKYYAEVILDESNKMDKLVRQLLELMRLEYGKREFNNDTFNICELIQEVIRKCNVMLEEKGIKEVRFEADKKVNVYADEFYIEQAFTNYFTNAIKHTKEVNGEKYIEIKLKEDKEKHKVKISVFNTGDTLSEENLERIWGRFYKVDESRNRADGGTGIGLALVKAIMNNYNSKYGAVNRENGIEFYFDIQTDAGIEK